MEKEERCAAKAEYVSRQLAKGCREDVTSFIAGILFDGRNDGDALRSFFRAGYCLYFAKMLEWRFGRGELCIAYPFGHVVWQDEDGICYDIEGPYVFEPGSYPLDIAEIGEEVRDFM